jgi:hypothetical protein
MIGSHFVRPNPGATASGAPGSMQNVANQDGRLTFGAICTPDVHTVANVLAG